jgi:nicotinamidase-related amidase
LGYGFTEILLSASAREYRVTVATDAVGALEDWTQRACFQIWRRKSEAS